MTSLIIFSTKNHTTQHKDNSHSPNFVWSNVIFQRIPGASRVCDELEETALLSVSIFLLAVGEHIAKGLFKYSRAHQTFRSQNANTSEYQHFRQSATARREILRRDGGKPKGEP